MFNSFLLNLLIKHFFILVPIMDFNRIIENTLSILLAGGVVAIGFFLLQKITGFLQYPGISPAQVDKVAAEIDSRFKIVTRALENETYRGIYDMGGVLYYYRYNPGKDFMIYPMLYEQFTTEPALMNNVTMLYPK
jgi:hypothetical protein